MTTTIEPVATSRETEKIAAIRAELPAVHHNVYFNTGTNGPLPRRSARALAEYVTSELEDGRIGAAAYAQSGQVETGTRAAFASLLGCDTSEVALTHNTSEGMNIALLGLAWQRGDELVTATTEHPGGLYPAYLLRQRFGVRIRQTGIGLQELDPVAELREVLTPRTRAVVLSHVSWASGMILPMREICDLAHGVGALVICDAAQACGMVPAPVYDLGVDAYACSGQKWLCGPDGTGALFVRRDRLGDIEQTMIGYRGVKAGASDYDGHFVPREGAERYQVATLSPATLIALEASLGWLADDLGWPWIYQRIRELGRACYDALAAVEGVTMYSPREQMAGLVHFKVEGITPAELTAKLDERHILIRYTPNPLVNRVSIGFYNTEEEIGRLVDAVQEIRGGR